MNTETATTPQARWYRATQDATLATADAHREPWEHDDLEFVIAFTDIETDADIAVALGRSLASIWSITHRVRRDGASAVRLAFASRRTNVDPYAARIANAPTYDFVTTFPPGYRD